MKWLSLALFSIGSALAWTALLRPLVQARYDPVRVVLARFWKQDRSDTLTLPELSAAERAFLEKARLAGVSWPFRRYRATQWLAAAAAAYLYLALSWPAPGEMASGALLGWAGRFVVAGAVAIACWFAPEGVVAWLAARRRTLALAEISKFAHRLSICMTEQADIRELIVRSGRPLRLLQPHIQRLAAQWGNDQREAILAFKDSVGISEAYPLVNAFAAISRAKPADIGRLLIEHSRSVDASLEAELTKRIENAPVWISFYIMIPFLVCLLLFVYPWVLTVLDQLAVSFSAG